MEFENYSLEYAPSPKDKKRYKLNLAGTEEDVKALVSKLSSMSSRPFPSPNKNFDWSFFIYDLNEEVKNKLRSELDNVINPKTETEGVTSDSNEPEVKKTPDKKESKTETENLFDQRHINLNVNYTFKNFIVGANTRFTHAACKAVAEKPGKSYNPLFIYGASGLGKTHLMQAIGNFVKEKFIDFTVICVSTDNFISEVVDAIEKGEINKLRAIYKKIDLLLIDDIQFLEQSESTQEEFFHIFNAMHSVGKQIVLTSDKPPKKLTTLEDRLKSRFEWGLTTDIKIPNLETRRAILKRKAEQAKITITNDISDYISERLTSNVRELEGIINRIAAYQELSHDQVKLDMIKDIIGNILSTEEADKETEEITPEIKEKKNLHEIELQPEQKSPVTPSFTQPQPPPLAPPTPAPYTAPQQPGNRCSQCGGVQLTFIPQYKRWYCTNCGMYVEPIQTFPPRQYQVPPQFATQPQPQTYIPPPPQQAELRCQKCNSPLEYIQKYERYYCRSCSEYAPVSDEESRGGVTAPPKEKVEVKEEKIIFKKPQKKKEPVKEDKEAQKKDFESRIIGEEKKDIRQIRTGYLLPEGAEDTASKIIEKLSKLATQKKFNFYVKPLFAHYYAADLNINYDKIAHICKTNDIDIALCMEPGEKSGISSEEFNKNIGQSMDKVGVPYEIMTQNEIKDSDALNLMLDIAICAKKRKVEK